jgi:hypothetical protein
MVCFSISVNSLIAISGYFGVTSQFNSRRLFCLWLTVFFYVNVGVRYATWEKVIGWSEDWWFTCWFPICKPAYWFISSYFQMMCAAPALNLGAKALTKRQYFFVILGLFGWEMNSCRSQPHIFPSNFGYSPVHFGIVYFLAAYFRLHGNPLNPILTWIGFGLSAWAQYYLLHHNIGKRFHGHWRHFICSFTGEFGNYSNFFSIVLALMALLVFRTMSITGSFGEGVNFVGGRAFAIYLVHQHPSYRVSLYPRWFRSREFKRTPEECMHNHLKFTPVVCIISVAIDIYRDFLFRLVEAVDCKFQWGWHLVQFARMRRWKLRVADWRRFVRRSVR